jgi:hypothetical protein
MRAWRAIVGAVLVVVGSVWILQGGGVLNGSSMSGQRFWLWIGVGCVAIGVFLLARWRRAARR